jgi:WD40 repeat protein
MARGKAEDASHLEGDYTQILSFQAHYGEIVMAQFSPDGHWLATKGDDDLFKLWRVESGSIVLEVEARVHGQIPWSQVSLSEPLNFQWSGSGSFILASAKGLGLWELVSPLSRRLSFKTPEGDSASIASLKFSPTERWLACRATGLSYLPVIDLQNLDAGFISYSRGADTYIADGPAFSPQGDRLWDTSLYHHILWQLPLSTPKQLLELTDIAS